MNKVDSNMGSKAASSTLKGRGVIDLGLGRLQHALQQVGSPHTQVPLIHVAGTNGKGSVCSYIHRVLQNQLQKQQEKKKGSEGETKTEGRRLESGGGVGIFTSPHLVDVTDCIRVGDVPITSVELENLKAEILEASTGKSTDCSSSSPSSPSLSSSSELTSFELLTGAAFLYFARRRCPVAVIEVGLGGRLDSTNVIEKPLVSIITSIGLDHMNLLGNTVLEIAKEKAGIIKPHCPVVIGKSILGKSGGDPGVYEKENNEIISMVQEKCSEYESPFYLTDSAVECDGSTGRGVGVLDEEEEQLMINPFPLVHQTIAKFVGLRFQLGLPGKFQLDNSALAVNALLCLRDRASASNGTWSRDSGHMEKKRNVEEEEGKKKQMDGRNGTSDGDDISCDEILKSLTNEDIEKGISDTRWKGRLEWNTVKLRGGCEAESSRMERMRVLVDGAHNTAAARSLREYIDGLLLQKETGSTSERELFAKKKIIWILAMTAGKDIDGVLKHLLCPQNQEQVKREKTKHQRQIVSHSVHAVTFTPPSDMPWIRSSPAEEVCARAKDVCGGMMKEMVMTDGDIAPVEEMVRCQEHGSLRDAFEGAARECEEDTVVCMAGSLYLVGDFMRYEK
eukprot:Nk52_evm33s2152 gene=Nk52_evmTU33s2152